MQDFDMAPLMNDGQMKSMARLLGDFHVGLHHGLILGRLLSQHAKGGQLLSRL